MRRQSLDLDPASDRPRSQMSDKTLAMPGFAGQIIVGHLRSSTRCQRPHHHADRVSDVLCMDRARLHFRSLARNTRDRPHELLISRARVPVRTQFDIRRLTNSGPSPALPARISSDI